jgi:hypothetical protein
MAFPLANFLALPLRCLKAGEVLRRWNMTVGNEEYGIGLDEEAVEEAGAVHAEEGHETNGGQLRSELPWIGSLPNPHVGPMVVVNDNGYLVPLFTATDLLRGCRYFWHTISE